MPVHTLAVTILVFGLLIFIHELGHFLAARAAGVRVHEFALGFGPVLVAWRRGPTRYSVRALPLGGFVRMAGMHPGEEDLAEVPPRQRFLNQALGWRTAIIAAGPAMNLVLALVLFAALFGLVGVPESRLVVAAVEPGYPAEAAGFRPGDRLLAVDGRPLEHWQQLVAVVRQHPGRPLRFQVERDGRTLELVVVPRPLPEDPRVGVIGIRPVSEVVRRPPGAALREAATWTARVALGFAEGLARLLRGEGGTELIGPVGIGEQLGQAARAGVAQLLFLAAVLSANLALINLLPIPALDGSRLMFLALEAVRGRPVDPEKEHVIHLIGFALLILLGLVITYRDILRLAT